MPTLAPCLVMDHTREVAPLSSASAEALRDAIARAAPGATPWRAATRDALATSDPTKLFAILFATRSLVPGEEHSVSLSHRELLDAGEDLDGARAALEGWFKAPAFGKGKGRVFLLPPAGLAALATVAEREGVEAADWAAANKQLEHADLPEDTLRVILGIARTWADREGVGLAWILDEDLEPARRALEDRADSFTPLAPALAQASLPAWTTLTWVYAVRNIAGARYFADADNISTNAPLAFAAVWYGPRPRGGHAHVAYTTHRGEVAHMTPASPGLWAWITDQTDPMLRYTPFKEGPCGRAGCATCAAAVKVAGALAGGAPPGA